jgi:hypothetical protein
MAWFIPFVVANIGTIASVGAAAYGAYGSIKQGKALEAFGRDQKAAADAQAGQDRAVAQFQAERQKREGKALGSRQRALLADSGFAADDPTALNLVDETVKTQTLEEMLTLAQGEQTAQSREQGGAASAKQSQMDADAQYGQAATTLMSSATSWYDRYGGGTPRRETSTQRANARRSSSLVAAG